MKKLCEKLFESYRTEESCQLEKEEVTMQNEELQEVQCEEDTNGWFDKFLDIAIILEVIIVLQAFFVTQDVFSVVIVDSRKEVIIVLLLSFIGTWITDLFCNRNNLEEDSVNVPFSRYMITNSVLILAEQFMKGFWSGDTFFMLYTTCVRAFVMSLLSYELFHETYKNKASANVKILFVMIPFVALVLFICYIYIHNNGYSYY